MKTILFFLFTTILVAKVFGQENNTIIIYEDANYGASYLALDSNWQAKNQHSIWDDKISSIRVPEGAMVVIYENSNFSGAHKILYNDWKATGRDEAWDNKISSIRFFNSTKPYSMVYQCYLQDGTKDLWRRTSDFILTDNAKAFFGIDQIQVVSIDTADMSLIFKIQEENGITAKVFIDGNELYGWVQKADGSRQNLHGYLVDLIPGNHTPITPQRDFLLRPISTEKDEKNQISSYPGQYQYPSTNYSEGVRVFKTANFTGESRYVEEDWSFGDIVNDDDFFDWWRQIKSIRVPKGWAIICYRSENFSGTSIQITNDWIPANDPDWNEDIKSIRIVRKGFEDYWGNFLNPGVIVYKEKNFTGESRYVEEDWSFGDIVNNDDFFDWWRQIKSIHVPRGWAITCYTDEDFSGNSIQITGDWIPANDPRWNENIKSIKIVRHGRK